MENSFIQGHSEICWFFHKKNVFITGVTGFLGKVLLEKLLRSCDGLNTVYVLLRAKKEKTPQQRLEQLLGCQLLDVVRKECPDALLKVVPIVGDVTLPNLGIGQEDRKLLIENVHVVFHCAATVRFDESLKRAVDINLHGTKKVLELCHQMHNLAVLVHVSTAYCFCNRMEVEEQIYPEKYSHEKVSEATMWMNEDLLSMITPHFLDGRPSTYHLTKALSENLLLSESNVNLAIVRPSIVTASYREPFPGWIDSYNGLSGFIVAAGKGVIRTMMVNNEVVADIVPVDFVVNMMIAAAWDVGRHRCRMVTVYNCTSGSLNKITWGDIKKLCYPSVIQYPSMEVFRYPGGSFKTNKMWHVVCQQLEHFLPAYIVDFLAWVTGNKPGMVKLYKKIHGAVGVLEYFTTKEWTFKNDNVVTLRNKLSEDERDVFDFDMKHVDWTSYMETFVRGVRKYLLQEDDATLPAARRKLNMVYYCWKGIHLALFAAVYGVMKQSTLLDFMWEEVKSFVY